MNFAIAHRALRTTTTQRSLLPSEAPGLKWRERRQLRRAERAQGMDPQTRERTNALIRSLDLPTGRRSL